MSAEAYAKRMVTAYTAACHRLFESCNGDRAMFLVASGVLRDQALPFTLDAISAINCLRRGFSDTAIVFVKRFEDCLWRLCPADPS